MSNNTLDLSPKEFKALLEKTNELVLKQYEDLEDKKAYHHYPQEEVESWFNEPIPKEGISTASLFEEIEEKVLNKATNNLGPHFYAYVISGANQVSVAAETLANTVNQNQTKWHLSPPMNEIEKRVVAWTSEMIGYVEGAGGVMVSGGSAANLTGLTVARNIFFEKENIKSKGLFGLAPMIVYASKEVHNCVDKSLVQLGIGTDNLRRVACNEDLSVNLEALEAQILADKEAGYRPFCIVGSAGTVNTGAIDDLNGLADLAEKHELWFHVDGAYGGLVSALEELKPAYVGIERADSVALDFHKWLYQPFEIGCTLVKNWSMLRRTYFNKADYLDVSESHKIEFNEHYFQLSRNAKAFKVWVSLKYYGFERIKEMIRKDIDLTNYLQRKIEASDDFEMRASGQLAAICFVYKGKLTDEAEITALNQRIIPALEKDERVFMTGTKIKGKTVLRACLINHRKTEATTDYLLKVIREVGEGLLS